jgi:hypothetical protein
MKQQQGKMSIGTTFYSLRGGGGGVDNGTDWPTDVIGIAALYVFVKIMYPSLHPVTRTWVTLTGF